jgi:hypothetical protein
MDAQGDFIFVNKFVFDELLRIKSETALQSVQTSRWPVLRKDNLSSSVLKSLLPGSQEATTFIEFHSTAKVDKVPPNYVAGFKAGSSKSCMLEKERRLPSLVPLGAFVTEGGSDAPVMVTSYHLNDGEFSVELYKKNTVTFPTDKQFWTQVVSFQKLETAYFGSLVRGYILQIRSAQVFVLVPGSLNWAHLPGTEHVSGYHNGILDKSSTQILKFRTAADVAYIFTLVCCFYDFFSISTCRTCSYAYNNPILDVDNRPSSSFHKTKNSFP